MEAKISENEQTYVVDVVDSSGKIITTYTANIRGSWGMAVCVMEEETLNNNLTFCTEAYDNFIKVGKEKAKNNGLIVF